MKQALTFIRAVFVSGVTSLVLISAAQARLSDPWLPNEASLSLQKIVENISPPDGRPGAIIAARSKEKPNYYYHWVRDAGIVMVGVANEYAVANPHDKPILRRKLSEYLDFSTYIQKVPAPTGLGEPKFNVDGSAYTGPWGRPQNDGPALRAISLIHWALVLIREGQIDFVRAKMYDARVGVASVIKNDLEYVSHHWTQPSFDLWEEVRGDHFYTRMVQRRAMIEGSRLAELMGDHGASAWYSRQARLLETELMKFWDPARGYFMATLNQVEGLDYKTSQLDTAVILGLLHGSLNDGFLPFSDPRVLSTLDKISKSFVQTFSINQKGNIPGVAIGRYPEDRYGGVDFNGGNPWPLCTLALAEAYYRAAGEVVRHGGTSPTTKLAAGKMAMAMLDLGDVYVQRVQFHANVDGSLSEQMDRNTGFMTSVPDLTWNYAAVLSTLWERNATATQMQTLAARKR